MHYMDTYNFWKMDSFFDETTRSELGALDPEADKKEIEDRFYQDLEFGTGGLRGIMGAGTNRMNKYTVGKATEGLGRYLLHTYGEEACKTRGVFIGYDTRNHSEEFSCIAARVLSSMCIRVYVYDRPCPAPQISFAVKHWNTLAGVVVTASHNPKEYNGYKVYDESGCQLVPWQAKQVIKYVNAVTDYRTICMTGDMSYTRYMDVKDPFVDAVRMQARYENKEAKENLNIVYTPLHGTGNLPVQTVLSLEGFTQLHLVKEQENPDGNFPTVISPNPEDRRALEMGITQAMKNNADIVLGTDPDSDRVGIAVKTNAGYQLMTGNQVGALLMEYILNNTEIPNKGAVVKTIVTSELGAEIARKKGLTVFTTLTGFKFIGEKITQFELASKEGNTTRDYQFIFGYEESYGYLAGTHARDKDAVVSALLICEMAAKAKTENKTLADKMEELYAEYGYYRDALDSFSWNGKEGLEKISAMMSELRNGDSPFEDTRNTIDYSKPVKAEEGFGTLPTSNVLKYVLTDGSWVAVRPSGTEPKIKIYYSVKGTDQKTAEEKLEALRAAVKSRLGLVG